MYFVNETALKNDLATRTVPSSDVAVYSFLLLGGQIPVWYPVAIPEDYDPSGATLLLGLFSIFVAIWGFRSAWRANGANDGELFADKLVSLGWVAGFQLALGSLPLFLLSAFWNPEWTRDWTPAFWAVLQILFYFRLWMLFKETKEIEDARRITSRCT